MDDRSRAELAFDAHLSYMTQLTEAGGGTVTRTAGGLLLRSPHPRPSLVNIVARLDTGAPPDALLDAAGPAFAGRGYELVCLAGRDDDLREFALAAGLSAGHADPLQYLAARPAASPADRTGLAIREVSDPSGVADLISVNGDASAVYELFEEDFFPTILGRPETIIAENITPYVVDDHGLPVATAQLVLFGNVAYVAWVSVVRSHMGRGLGWLVTQTVVEAGFERGATRAVLMASPMGAPLYRKMGFVDVGSVNSVFAEAHAG